jgi:hypothetical protein
MFDLFEQSFLKIRFDFLVPMPLYQQRITTPILPIDIMLPAVPYQYPSAPENHLPELIPRHY